MEIRIVGRNMDLSEGLKAYVDKRLSGLDRYSRNIVDAQLTLWEERGQYHGEFLVHVKGKTLKAVDQAKDPFEVVDRLKDIMKGHIEKYEGKLKDRHR